MRGTTGRGLWTAVALAAMLAAPAARADGDGKPAGGAAPAEAAKPKDDRPVSSDEAAKQAIERFEADFRSNDIGRKMNAVQSLSRTKNDLVTKRLAKLLSHPDPEVRGGVALLLNDMYQNETLAGETLRKHIGREDDPSVLVSAMLSLGRLNHVDAIPEMGEVCKKSGDAWVKIETMKSFAKMKDRRALLPILDLWLVNPQGYSWEGGEVKYDSGAPGDADQREAERQYKEKYGHQGRRGAPPTMLKTYIQNIVLAVEAICGTKLSSPTELMMWMCEHEKELGYPLPGKVKATLKEFQERAAKKKKDEKK